MFFKTILTNEPKQFQIGGFRIAALHENDFINEPAKIPGSFMAFEKAFSEEADFQFQVNSDLSISRGTQLFRADNFMRNAIYESTEDSWDWVWYQNPDQIGLEFQVAKDFSKITLVKRDADPQYAMIQLGYMFSYGVLLRDACVLHGIILEYQGNGILVLAKSGTGKSTHAHLWRDEEDALIINGDRCLCRKIDGQWYAYGSPWCGNSGEYMNRRVPITNIVFLERGPVNMALPLDPFEGTMRLLESIKAPQWSQELYMKAMDRCDELVRDIPMWRMYCTPDAEAVKVLKEALFQE